MNKISTKEELCRKIKDNLCNLRDDILAICAFGSFATKDEFKDIDLMVVLDLDYIERKEWIDTVNKMRQAMYDDVPFRPDILLQTKLDCESGFNDHLFLYVDIAFDGLIIYDPIGFLEDLMRQTKEYIINRGWKRTPTGGWRFPVNWRKPTILSPFTNGLWAEDWIDDAKRDLEAAKNIFKTKIFDKGITHCQQVAEKAVKSVLICIGEFEKSHFVGNILKKELDKQDFDNWNEKLYELACISEALEPEIIFSRYIGKRDGKPWIPKLGYDENMAKEALENAKKALEIAEGFVKWWFKEE
jgi:HEPN domain-containing protein